MIAGEQLSQSIQYTIVLYSIKAILSTQFVSCIQALPVRCPLPLSSLLDDQFPGAFLETVIRIQVKMAARFFFGQRNQIERQSYFCFLIS